MATFYAHYILMPKKQWSSLEGNKDHMFNKIMFPQINLVFLFAINTVYMLIVSIECKQKWKRKLNNTLW